ncbi:MAG: hypothetical protein CMH73_02065 [Nitrospina sp.]|nr:hypothetical protein [Nitrospina sp.]
MFSHLKFFIILFAVFTMVTVERPAWAKPLDVLIQNEVDDTGNVNLLLTLKNSGSRSIYHIRPMFHFHHSMSMMSKIMRLDPGQSITLENDKHPPVRRVGRYPLTAMVEFWLHPNGGTKKSVLFTDSFFFKEPLISKVEGKLASVTDLDSSILNVFLKNRSESLKNIRMMLLLPPGLAAKNFSGVMGFTMRGGEAKNFQIRVFRRENIERDRFPVRLMIEYGEMLKHYSSEINGTVRFSPVWYSMKYMPHFTVLALMALILLSYYYRIYNKK